MFFYIYKQQAKQNLGCCDVISSLQPLLNEVTAQADCGRTCCNITLSRRQVEYSVRYMETNLYVSVISYFCLANVLSSLRA